jgi:hypothetical protein
MAPDPAIRVVADNDPIAPPRLFSRLIRNRAPEGTVGAESPAHQDDAADARLSADCLRSASGAAPAQPMSRPTPSRAPIHALRRRPFSQGSGVTR